MVVKYWDELYKKYKSGVSNSFIITGNINDYVKEEDEKILLFEHLLLQLKNYFDNIYIYNCPDGLALYKAKDSNKVMPLGETVMPYIVTKNILNEEKTVVVFKYPEYFFGTNNAEYNVYSMIELLTNRKYFTSDNMIIFLSETISNISKDLTSKMSIIKINYPSYEERLNFIKREINQYTFEKNINEEVIAKLTAGLTLINIEDIFLLAEYEGKLNRDLIVNKKKEIIENTYGDIIELFDVEDYNFKKFAGYEELKKYHKEVIIEGLLNNDSSIVPKGLLYIGPPGTGKTFFAKCFAGESQINFIELKLSKILNKYVGESEKNFEKALNCISSLTPCGVFIDELDQAFQRGNNDNTGVRSNIFGRLLSFMSDDKIKGKIIFIGASNYPNNIDEALKRPGRFDKKIPFLPPNKANRIETFKVLLSKYYDITINVSNWNKIGELTEMYTQAEIENVVLKTIELIKRQKKTIVTDEDIIKAIGLIKRKYNDKIKEMIQIALEETDDYELLPKEYQIDNPQL